jgi:hypothetical protein
MRYLKPSRTQATRDKVNEIFAKVCKGARPGPPVHPLMAGQCPNAGGLTARHLHVAHCLKVHKRNYNLRDRARSAVIG